MAKQKERHPHPEIKDPEPGERAIPTGGEHEPDIRDGKNKNKRNNSPRQRQEDEPGSNINGEEPVEDRSPDTSASL